MDKETLETTNKLALDFDKRLFHIDMSLHYRWFINNLSGKKILDMGCGVGRDTVFFTKAGFDCTGLDISKGMLEIARKRVGKYINMAFEDYKPEHKFNGIWCCAALYHTPKKDVSELIEKFYNLLDKDGVVFLAVKEGKGEGLVSRDVFNGQRKYYALYELDELLRLFHQFKIKYFIREVKLGQTWLNLVLRKNNGTT